MPEKSRGIGCFVAATVLAVFGALALYFAVAETMRGTPLTSEPGWQMAKGGELLTTGERAKPGESIKPEATVLEFHLVGLLVGGGALVLAIVTLIAGLQDYRAWKRNQREKE